MNDAKAKAYRWAHRTLRRTELPAEDRDDGAFVDEVMRLTGALGAAAEHRAAAPEVPPPDPTMVTPGYRPRREPLERVMAATCARCGCVRASDELVTTNVEGDGRMAPRCLDVAWCERQGHAAATDKAPKPSPPVIVALPEVPAPPCPRCGKHVAAADMAEHPCGLPAVKRWEGP